MLQVAAQNLMRCNVFVRCLLRTQYGILISRRKVIVPVEPNTANAFFHEIRALVRVECHGDLYTGLWFKLLSKSSTTHKSFPIRKISQG